LARTLIPKVTAAYQSSTLLQTNASAIQVDMANGMYYVNPRNQVTVFYVINSSAMTSTTVTVTAVTDKAGRGSTCNDITKAVDAGKIFMFGPYSAVWWNQPTGIVYVDFSATNAAIKILAVQIA
jgi:hypothetical protein